MEGCGFRAGAGTVDVAAWRKFGLRGFSRYGLRLRKGIVQDIDLERRSIRQRAKCQEGVEDGV